VKRLFVLWLGVVVSWWSSLASAQTAPSDAPVTSRFLAPRRPDGTSYVFSAGADAGVPATDAAPTVTAVADAGAPAPAQQPASAPQSPVATVAAPGVAAGASGASGGAVATGSATGSATVASTGGSSLPTGSVGTAPPSTPVRRPSLNRARLRLLDASFTGLAARSSSQRILDGILSIGVGGALTAASFALPPLGAGTDLQPWLWATSGYLALQGIVNIAWAPARERLSNEYNAMPRGTARQRRERLRFGERAMDEIAADGSRRRILSGIANIVVTGGLVTAAYAEPIFNGTPHTFGLNDAVVLTYGGVTVIMHVIQMLSASEDERLRNAYFQQVELLRAERAESPN
jgi:hypothetical protein